METKFLTFIQESLNNRRRNLSNWLSGAPGSERQSRLGPVGEPEVHNHLRAIDSALENTYSGAYGVCEVCQEEIETELLEIDYACCVCIDHLTSEQRRQLENELELSQAVQRGLLPQSVPEIPGLDLAFFNRPAQIVGGDTFDFSQFRDHSQGISIADVAGHGMGSSMLMASVQTALRTFIPASDSPAEICERLNHYFIHNIRFTTFVTLFVGKFEPTSGLLSYSNAGHNPPLVVRAGVAGQEAIEWLKPNAPAIGLVEDYPAPLGKIFLSPGDILLLYTDGVTELVNNQGVEFGKALMAATIMDHPGESARDLVQALRGSLQDHTGGLPFEDDVTIIACRKQDAVIL